MVPDSKAAPGERTGDPAEPGDFPALREIEKFLAKSEYSKAVLAAFPLVMVDVQRAFGTTFPPHWTGRDVLAHGLRPDSGNLPSLLYSLYRLYEPVRFGRESDWTPGDLRGIVQRIYAETPVGKRRAPRSPWSVASTVPVPGRPSQETPPPREGTSW
ncbi:MAG TPA: hypothetical protein VEK13_07280 [Thermoplasmata archaeon]|nr:hypothetical protein [Thermoplasmata archaeon]